MKITISNLADGEHRYEFTEEADFFDLEQIKSDEKIKISVVLNKIYRQLFLKVHLEGNVFFPCDRCLEEFRMEIQNNFEAIYKLSQDDYDDANGDNVFFISPETNIINIKDMVRDYLLLAIPMRKVPDEINGICTVCNRDISKLFSKKSDEEVNPVWDKLLSNKDRNKDKKIK